MTVRAQNLDILSAMAAKQAAGSAGGGARTSSADVSTSFVDVMATLGAQSDSLVDAAKQTVLSGRLLPARSGGDAQGASMDPLQVLSRCGVESSRGELDGRVDDRAPAVSRKEPVERVRSESPALVDGELAFPEPVEELVVGESLREDAVAPDRLAEGVELMDVRDLVRDVPWQLAGPERVAAGKGELPAPTVRNEDVRLAMPRVQPQDVPVEGDVPPLAEMPALRKAVSRANEAAQASQGRETSRAPELSSTFSETLFRAGQGGSADGSTMAPGAIKEARPAPAMHLQVAQPFGGQQWNAAMNAQVLTMMKDGVAQARIQINPQNLGPVGIDLSMRDGVVNVSFESPYDEVRDALRDGVKGLERSLSEGGVQLGRVEVRDSLDFMTQSRQQRDGQQDAPGGQRQQQESRQGRQDGSDFASHMQVTDEDNVRG